MAPAFAGCGGSPRLQRYFAPKVMGRFAWR
jgi:hypothetical protein